MGAVYFGLDAHLVGFFRKHLPLKSLVETGTYEGETLAAFVDEFEALYSVEISGELFEKARERFADQQKVELIDEFLIIRFFISNSLLILPPKTQIL